MGVNGSTDLTSKQLEDGNFLSYSPQAPYDQNRNKRALQKKMQENLKHTDDDDDDIKMTGNN